MTKDFFARSLIRLIPCKNVCGGKYVASEQARLLGTRQASTRAQGQRVIASQHDLACWPTPTPSSLLRYFCEKQKSATLRILQKVLPLHLPAARSHLPARDDQPPPSSLAKKFGRTATLDVRSCFKSMAASRIHISQKVVNMGWAIEVGCRMEEKVRQGSTPAAPSGVDLSLAGVALALKQG